MKSMNLMKVAMAVALLFAVNMEADAQLGKLKGLAKKAKETVTGSGSSTTTTPTTNGNNPLQQVTSAVRQVEAATDTPEEHERKVAEEANYWMGKWGEGYNLSNSNAQARKEFSETVEKFKQMLGVQKITVKRINYSKRLGEDYFEDYYAWTRNNHLIEKHPEYTKDDVTDVERRHFAVYYKKDGKCYVSRGEIRELQYTDQQAHGLKSRNDYAKDPNWNPGLHPAVEVPAEIYEQYSQYFK